MKNERHLLIKRGSARLPKVLSANPQWHGLSCCVARSGSMKNTAASLAPLYRVELKISF